MMSESRLKAKDDSTPYKGVCSKRCYYAKGKRCKCKCHGQYHQKGLVTQGRPKSEEEFKRLANAVPLSEEMSETIMQIMEKALEQHPEWAKHVKKA